MVELTEGLAEANDDTVAETLGEADAEPSGDCEAVTIVEPESDACGEADAETLVELDSEICGDCEAVTIGEADAEPGTDAVAEVIGEPDSEICGDCELVAIGEVDAEPSDDCELVTIDEPDTEPSGDCETVTIDEPDSEICAEMDAETLGEADGEICDERLAEKDDTSDEEPVTDCVKEPFADVEPVDETDGLFETEIEPDDDPVFELKAEVVDVWVDVTLPRDDLEVVAELLKLRVPTTDFVSVGLAVWLRVGRLLLDTELEIEPIPDTVPLNEEYSETVKHVLTVANEDALIDGLPLDDQEATSDDDVLGLADPEPDNEDELEIVFWDVHDGE